MFRDTARRRHGRSFILGSVQTLNNQHRVAVEVQEEMTGWRGPSVAADLGRAAETSPGNVAVATRVACAVDVPCGRTVRGTTRGRPLSPPPPSSSPSAVRHRHPAVLHRSSRTSSWCLYGGSALGAVHRRRGVDTCRHCYRHAPEATRAPSQSLCRRCYWISVDQVRRFGGGGILQS